MFDKTEGATPRPADMEGGRCIWCDSRYCYTGCYAEVPGYVYAVGHGYVPEAEAIALFDAGRTCRVDAEVYGEPPLREREVTERDVIRTLAAVVVAEAIGR